MTSATTTSRGTAGRGKPDQICADAVDLARSAVIEAEPGAHIEVVAEGERVVTHYFECLLPGYRGWRWAVTVARVPRSKQVTICETVLLPGPDALVTPDWVPWQDRVEPGDLGVGDLMPTSADDERLAPGYLLSDDPAVEDVVWELGLGRVRVLSREGRLDAADRWYAGEPGPDAPISQAAPAHARCVACGFYLPLAGAMRPTFGVCANMFAPDDGRVVAADHGCGAHSEVLPEVPVDLDDIPTIYDDNDLDMVAPEPEAIAAEVEVEVVEPDLLDADQFDADTGVAAADVAEAEAEAVAMALVAAEMAVDAPETGGDIPDETAVGAESEAAWPVAVAEPERFEPAAEPETAVVEPEAVVAEPATVEPEVAAEVEPQAAIAVTETPAASTSGSDAEGESFADAASSGFAAEPGTATRSDTATNTEDSPGEEG